MGERRSGLAGRADDEGLGKPFLPPLPVAEDVAVEGGALGVVLHAAVPLGALGVGQPVGAEDLVDRDLGQRRDLGQLLVGRALGAEQVEQARPEGLAPHERVDALGGRPLAALPLPVSPGATR